MGNIWEGELLRIVLVFYGVMILVGPVLLRKKFRSAAKINPQPVPFESLPPQVQGFMTPRLPQIANVGFAPVAYFQIGTIAGKTASFMALFSNTRTGEWADVSVITAPSGLRGYIEFIAHCSDTSQVDTNSAPLAPVLFPSPGYYVFRFPQIKDAFTLYRAHRLLVQEKLGGARPQLPPAGQEAAELKRRLERYGARQQEHGYMYLDATGNYYRLTWKGAFLGGWRSIWPVPALRRRLMQERGASTLRALNVA